MRHTIAKLSDSLLSLVAPRATASAKYCLACTNGGPCPGGWFKNCLNPQLGWIQIGCVQGGPNTCP